MLPRTLVREIDAIARGNVTGAMGLFRRAAQAIRRSACDLTSLEQIAQVAGAIESAQPAMAPMYHLARCLRDAAPSGAAGVARCAEELLTGAQTADEAIARHALAILPHGVTVLTHSSSGTVAAVLESAHRAGKLARAIVTESRPLCEGVGLARRLAAQGIAVDLVIDAALAHVLGDAHIVLVGADTLSAGGLVNKIGTHLAALAAREQGIPFWVVCGSLKIAPAGLPHAAQASHPASEIAGMEIPGVRIRNQYFDTTPVELLTGVVTENGILRDYRGL